MKTYQKVMFGCAGIVPALMIAGTAQAQVSGIAIADPETVILTAKALEAANTSIATTYKTQLDQSNARAQALQTELNALYAPLDANHDKQLDDAELAAAQNAKNPALAKIDAAQKAGQVDINRLRGPAVLAQAYAIEQISQKYQAAMKAVVDSKKISLLLSANSVQFTTPAADVTEAIRTEFDRVNPTVSITPPAGWQPTQQTQQLQQAYSQSQQYAAAVQAQRARQGAAATPPATGTKAPTGR